LGETAAESLRAEVQKGPFSSVEDLADRCGVNKNVVRGPPEPGCLGNLPDSDQGALF
jgi:DNA polymerase III alpha subunit (gram-positive type)